MTRCLDDETMLGMVEGRLAPAALAGAEDHLDLCATCRDVIGQLARARGPRMLERGHTVGRYVIGDLLGSGAMGHVYSAWEPELDRRVAVKLLRDDTDRERLLREAQAMARLDHPNVVGVHEVGTAGEAVFVAMDLVEGETLRAWAERRPPWRDVVRVAIDVARGLAAVHAAGVIHRDVKPDNIIIGNDGRARIGDFGLARANGAPSSPPASRALDVSGASTLRDRAAAVASTIDSGRGDPTLLRSVEAFRAATAIAGTPLYMAPEVLRGESATAASDQFGFGVTLYELLAGKRPFSGHSLVEIERAIERDPIPPLRGVPSWLEVSVRRCLALEPARRFASLVAVAAHLEERLHRRRPVAVFAGVAALVASGVTWVATRGEPAQAPAVASCDSGGTEIAALWNPEVRARLGVAAPAIDRWTVQWASERDATCRAAATTAGPALVAREHCLERRHLELAALLARAIAKPEGAHYTPLRFESDSEVAPLADRLTDALAALSPLDCRTARPGLADPLPLDPDRVAAVREVERALPAIRAAIALGDARGLDEEAERLVTRARASNHAPTIAEALLARAETLHATAHLFPATDFARDAAAAAERGRADDTAARAWLTRVRIAGDRRDLAAADDLAAIADAAIDRAGASTRMRAAMLRLRALVAYHRGNLSDAREKLVAARALFVELSGERSVDVAAIESSLGSTARAIGDLDAAERHHRTALAIDRALRDKHHPDIARDLHNIAGVLRLRDDLESALATYREALELQLAKRGEVSVQVAITRNSIALVAMARRDWATARTELERARATFITAGHGDRVFVEHNLGLVAAATGDHARALEYYKVAGELYATTIGDLAHPSIRLHLDRARSLPRGPAAFASARRALDTATKVNIRWIIDEATQFLAVADPVSTAVRVGIEPPPPRTQPVTQPGSTDQNPDPFRDWQPKRDVGTYGSSSGF